MKRLLTAAFAAFAIAFPASAQTPATPPPIEVRYVQNVPNQSISSGGLYLWQREHVSAGKVLAFTSRDIRIEGDASSCVKRVFIIDLATGKPVASSEWMWDSQPGSSTIEIQQKDSVLGERDYGLFAYIEGYVPGTVSVSFAGYGYAGDNTGIKIVDGSHATHTIDGGYFAGAYIQPTSDIDEKARPDTADYYAGFQLDCPAGSKATKVAFTLDVDGDKASAASLQQIVLLDFNHDRVAVGVKTVSEDKKHATVSFTIPKGLDVGGKRTFIVRATATQSLNNGKAAFSVDPDGCQIQDAAGNRVMVNGAWSNLIPLQTIELGKQKVQPQYVEDYYYYDYAYQG